MTSLIEGAWESGKRIFTPGPYRPSDGPIGYVANEASDLVLKTGSESLRVTSKVIGGIIGFTWRNMMKVLSGAGSATWELAKRMPILPVAGAGPSDAPTLFSKNGFPLTSPAHLSGARGGGLRTREILGSADIESEIGRRAA